MAEYKKWFERICGDARNLPVRYRLNGEAREGFPGAACEKDISLEDDIRRALLRFRLDASLRADIELNFDERFGALSWTVWFENDGRENSPVISDVDAANIVFPGADCALSGILGDHENNYAPYEKRLSDGPVRFYSDLGRPTHVYFPYFRLKQTEKDGCLIAIGWGGTWEAAFTREEDGASARFIGRGTNGLDAYLKPGEKIRTPLMLFLPYIGMTDDEAMNFWRRYYVARVLPKADGAPLRPFSTTGLMNDTGLPNSDGSISERYFTWKPSLEKMLSEGIHMDMRWFDAGWYEDPDGNTVPTDWWGTVGTWTLDPEKWPGDSFRESTDYARAHGMKTLMWFEPERVTHVDALCKNYGYKREWALGDPNGKAFGNDIGQRDCLEWTCEKILATLEKGGVDMYREDNNFNARPCWAAREKAQGPHRTGVCENMAVVAHYELWDRIIAFTEAHGGLPFVDSCASGGGRNDLESMRRAIPLLRSDADRTTTSLRLSMTTAFNQWIPFCGASCNEQAQQLSEKGARDQYILRASYLPALNLNAQWTRDPDTDFAFIRWALNEWKQVNGLLLKDFHVLTPWRDQFDKTGWTALAYSDPETDETALFAFRMEDADADTQTLCLSWLDPEALYELSSYDDPKTGVALTGEALRALTLTLKEKRTAALYSIRRAPSRG